MTGSRPPRLTRSEDKILRLLIAAPSSYGLELVARGGISRGSVYVLLARMEDKGFIQSQVETAPPDRYKGIPRRRYTATDLGLRAMRP